MVWMLRWAIVGTSPISHTMAKAISLSPGSTIAAVTGRDRTRLDTFCDAHGVDRRYLSLAETLGDPDVDVVYVATPNHVHHEAVIAAAAAGRAVLCEKSLAVSMNQTWQLVDSVRSRVFFAEGLMYLAHPVIARFLEVLIDGRLGEIKFISGAYAADISRFVNPKGRGVIYNLGCYPASLVQLVVDSVWGDGAFDHHELTALGTVSPVDGNICETAVSLRFSCGAMAVIQSAETYGMAASFEVHGTNGILAFVTNPWLPLAGENTFRWLPFSGAAEEFNVHATLDAFDHQVRMVETCVAAGRLEPSRPSPRIRDSVALMGLLTSWEMSALGDSMELSDL